MNVEDLEAPVGVATTGGVPQITLRGHVNVGAAAGLHRAALRLLEAGGDVAVDCQHADHLDAAVLQLLCALKEELRAQGRNFLLTGAPPSMQSFIRLAGLADALLAAAPGDTGEPDVDTPKPLLVSTGPCAEAG
jgi:anti-anti-sigma factor